MEIAVSQIDLLITHAGQLLTCASDGPKRGDAMRDVGAMEDGAVAVKDGVILDVGENEALEARYDARVTLNAQGHVVMPGFVDAHTHVVYAGDRVAEFEMRIQGATYMEIMVAGGGIVSTMRAVREADVDQLVAETRQRLDAMLALGTTTVEVKTGYGLSVEAELKLLEAIARLDQSHPATLVPTFLGAHAVPPEFAGRADAYIDLVVGAMIPAAAAWYARSHFARQGTPFFCDAFCEAGVFDAAQSRRVLEAGKVHGMLPKLHADEFENLGGVSLAVALGAVSVDHLDVTPDAEIERLAASDTVGVVIPAVNFNLGSCHFADARKLIDAGAALALATDINPGSAPCPSLPMVMAIATRYQRLLPAEALNAATINAAYAVGLGEEVGSLQPGKRADILILNVRDYRHLAYAFGANPVATVIKAGAVVSP
ncbi:MAG TPA: imidazolonepropionase [Caldilineae bacterium]|nr:imidazolonepropionase [Caldilineae bacterium]